MPRTNLVKAFRGQRKCQFKPDSWSVCGQPKAVHEELDHEFTQKALTCGFCHKPINIGDPYKWVAPRAHRAASGIKKVRHTTCPGWKASELTSSQHLATIYAAQEDADAAMSGLGASTLFETAEAEDQLREIAEAFAETVREAYESYTESANAIEEGFGHETYQSEELREKAEAVEQWADEAASWSPDAFTEELECAECQESEEAEQHHDQDMEDFHDYDEESSVLEDWLQEQIDGLTDITSDMPL